MQGSSETLDGNVCEIANPRLIVAPLTHVNLERVKDKGDLNLVWT